MECGSMQALIDFDGWRKWKDYLQKTGEDDLTKNAFATRSKATKNLQSISLIPATVAA